MTRGVHFAMKFFLPQNSKNGTIFLPQKQQKQKKCMYQMNYYTYILYFNLGISDRDTPQTEMVNEPVINPEINV